MSEHTSYEMDNLDTHYTTCTVYVLLIDNLKLTLVLCSVITHNYYAAIVGAVVGTQVKK